MTQWIKPQATDLRYGFEITMYISVSYTHLTLPTN